MDAAETQSPRTSGRRKNALADHRFWLMGLVLLLLATAVVLRFWITSDAGRAFITSQIVAQLGHWAPFASGPQGRSAGRCDLCRYRTVDTRRWLRARCPHRVDAHHHCLSARVRESACASSMCFVAYAAGPDRTSASPHELNVNLALNGPAGVEALCSGGAIASPRNGRALRALPNPADTANVTLEWTREAAQASPTSRRMA
jgi:hypothetical protein